MTNSSQIQPRGVVFDLDGTLIDSAPDVRAALNRVLIAEGRREVALEEMHLLVGEGAGPMVDRAFRLTGEPVAAARVPDLVQRYLDHYRTEPALRTVVFTGAESALRSLRKAGWRLGICTNKPYEMTLLVLDALGLAPLFEAVTGGDNVPKRKPDGDHVLQTLRLMGVQPEDAVMIGDSPTDVAAARAAGMPVAVVNFGYGTIDRDATELEADLTFTSYDELLPVVEELFRSFRSER